MIISSLSLLISVSIAVLWMASWMRNDINNQCERVKTLIDKM
jgi:hypothetical protein